MSSLENLEKYATLKETANKWSALNSFSSLGIITCSALMVTEIIKADGLYYTFFMIVFAISFLFTLIQSNKLSTKANLAKKVCLNDYRHELLDKAFEVTEIHNGDEALVLIVKQHVVDAIRENKIASYQREIEYLETEILSQIPE